MWNKRRSNRRKWDRPSVRAESEVYYRIRKEDSPLSPVCSMENKPARRRWRAPDVEGIGKKSRWSIDRAEPKRAIAPSVANNIEILPIQGQINNTKK